MKKFFSAFFAFLLCFSSAYAFEGEDSVTFHFNVNPDISEPIVVDVLDDVHQTEDIEPSNVDVDDGDMEMPAQDAETGIDPQSTSRIWQDCYVKHITVYPLYYDADTKQLKYFDSQYVRRYNATGLQRFSELELTPESTKNLYNNVEKTVERYNNAGYNYTFWGWHFETGIYVQAQTPLYLQFTPEPLSQCTDTRTQNKRPPTQHWTIPVVLNFKDFPNHEDWQSIGIRGAFYFRYPFSNSMGSIYMNSDFSINARRTNS